MEGAVVKKVTHKRYGEIEVVANYQYGEDEVKRLVALRRKSAGQKNFFISDPISYQKVPANTGESESERKIREQEFLRESNLPVLTKIFEEIEGETGEVTIAFPNLHEGHWRLFLMTFDPANPGAEKFTISDSLQDDPEAIQAIFRDNIVPIFQACFAADQYGMKVDGSEEKRCEMINLGLQKTASTSGAGDVVRHNEDCAPRMLFALDQCIENGVEALKNEGLRDGILRSLDIPTPAAVKAANATSRAALDRKTLDFALKLRAKDAVDLATIHKDDTANFGGVKNFKGLKGVIKAVENPRTATGESDAETKADYDASSRSSLSSRSAASIAGGAGESDDEFGVLNSGMWTPSRAAVSISPSPSIDSSVRSPSSPKSTSSSDSAGTEDEARDEMWRRVKRDGKRANKSTRLTILLNKLIEEGLFNKVEDCENKRVLDLEDASGKYPISLDLDSSGRVDSFVCNFLDLNASGEIKKYKFEYLLSKDNSYCRCYVAEGVDNYKAATLREMSNLEKHIKEIARKKRFLKGGSDSKLSSRSSGKVSSFGPLEADGDITLPSTPSLPYSSPHSSADSYVEVPTFKLPSVPKIPISKAIPAVTPQENNSLTSIVRELTKGRTPVNQSFGNSEYKVPGSGAVITINSNKAKDTLSFTTSATGQKEKTYKLLKGTWYVYELGKARSLKDGEFQEASDLLAGIRDETLSASAAPSNSRATVVSLPTLVLGAASSRLVTPAASTRGVDLEDGVALPSVRGATASRKAGIPAAEKVEIAKFDGARISSYAEDVGDGRYEIESSKINEIAKNPLSKQKCNVKNLVIAQSADGKAPFSAFGGAVGGSFENVTLKGVSITGMFNSADGFLKSTFKGCSFENCGGWPPAWKAEMKSFGLLDGGGISVAGKQKEMDDFLQRKFAAKGAGTKFQSCEEYERVKARGPVSEASASTLLNSLSRSMQ